jgi:hypothetical protein
MVSRRQFIEMIAAMTAMGWTPCRASLRQAPVHAVYAGYTEYARTPAAVFDSRLPASRVFARRARTAGWQALELRPDVGDLWYHTLRPDFAAALYPLAGLTLESDFFVLKQLTAELGMDVPYQRRHEGGDALVSWVIAPRRDDSPGPAATSPPLASG